MQEYYGGQHHFGRKICRALRKPTANHRLQKDLPHHDQRGRQSFSNYLNNDTVFQKYHLPFSVFSYYVVFCLFSKHTPPIKYLRKNYKSPKRQETSGDHNEVSKPKISSKWAEDRYSLFCTSPVFITPSISADIWGWVEATSFSKAGNSWWKSIKMWLMKIKKINRLQIHFQVYDYTYM